ncbi:HIT family protein [Acuticoccus kandeliae]|uniref:HIT family protein n=1 Tax=Acuticoccus kandeliae TaxID=2073160 RepID=UPI000D3EC2CF|nr:HIT domain-containing protein [Acuticoccus kandeliae]
MEAAGCLFCRIAAGTVPSHRVHEDDTLVAFLDIGPIRTGHVQIVPRAHYPTFETCPDEVLMAITRLGKRIARVQKGLYGVPRVAFFFTGTDIAHTHAHLVPMVAPTDVTSRRYIQEEDLTFAPLPSPTAAELAAVAATLAAGLTAEGADG